MSLIIFGTHCNWTDILNQDLLPDLQPIIQSITVCSTINESLFTADHVLPLLESHMLELHYHNIKAHMPSKEAIETFQHKKLFAEYAQKYALHYYMPEHFTTLQTRGKKLCVKPFSLNAGIGIYITDKIYNEIFNNYVVQEYIHDYVEYTTHIIARNGIIIYHLTYQITFMTDEYIKGGINTTNSIIKINLDKQYLDILQMFLLPIKYDGICCVNFKIVNNKIYIFEINPRLGGTLLLHKNDMIEFLQVLFTC